jgi:hypothetical protein
MAAVWYVMNLIRLIVLLNHRPTGFGQRTCIVSDLLSRVCMSRTNTYLQGRAFAWQESLINVALTVQRFDLALADPEYELQLHSTLTIKPKNLHIRASLRPGRQSLCFVPLAAV